MASGRPEGNSTMPLMFYSGSATTKNSNELHTSFRVTGGTIDTSVADGLKDVTLSHTTGDNYVLVVKAATPRERATRSQKVYGALVQRLRDGNERQLKRLIQADKAT
jgi:hypothetical protein